MSAPWMKFYPADWQADPALRSCSLAARGLWIEMLCVMQKAEPIGGLTINGRPITTATLAVLAGCQERDAIKLLAELNGAGVFSIHPATGVLFSRRIIRDAERAERDKANGRKGGNPSVMGGVNPRLNPKVNGGDKAQKLEAREDPSQEEDTSKVYPFRERGGVGFE